MGGPGSLPQCVLPTNLLRVHMTLALHRKAHMEADSALASVLCDDTVRQGQNVRQAWRQKLTMGTRMTMEGEMRLQV